MLLDLTITRSQLDHRANGGGNGNGGGQTNRGTALGAYTITVAGTSGTLQQTTTIALTVN
jgi:hypothetical protein